MLKASQALRATGENSFDWIFATPFSSLKTLEVKNIVVHTSKTQAKNRAGRRTFENKCLSPFK